MAKQSFIVRRSPFLSLTQLECIEAAMFRILSDVGVAVLNEEILRKLKSSGFQSKGDSIVIDGKLVQEFLAAERARNGRKLTEEHHAIAPSSHASGLFIPG